MKRAKPLLVGMITILLLGVIVWPVFAQTPSVIRADVDRTSLSTDELLVLTIIIDTTAGALSSPNIPPLDGFEILSRSSGNQISIINGDMSMVETHTYMLHPIGAGELTIDPITVNHNGQVYATHPITIQVSQGTGQAQPPQNTAPTRPSFPSIPGFPSFPNLPGFQFPSLPGMPSMPSTGLDAAGPTFSLDPSEAPPELNGQDFFIEAKVDQESPFQGEQVLYRLRFFQSVELWEEIEYIEPSFTGLWHEQLPDQMVYTLENSGRTYRVTEIQTILFPTVVGEVTIEPSVVNIPGDIFSRGYVLESDPITLSVSPLPAGAPAGFQGAVGDFDIQAEVDTNQTMVNEPITLRYTVQGQGNLNTLPEPELNSGNNWRAYNSQSNVEAEFKNGELSGSRTYERLFVPSQAGMLTIPSIQYYFFDPAQGVFKTTSTQPLVVQVSGPPEPIAPTSEAEIGNTNTPNAKINPLKASEEILDVSVNLVEQPVFWVLWGLPLVILTGQLTWTKLRKRTPDLATRKSQGAAKTAIKSLHRLPKDPDQAGSVVGQILLKYISDKLNKQVAGLTMDELCLLLVESGVQQNLISRLQNCLLVSEMGRYAPVRATSASEDIVPEAEAIVNALDKVL